MTLQCTLCDTSYEDRCRCSCGGPLQFTTYPELRHPPPPSGSIDTRQGLWSFRDFFPEQWSHPVTLGEGMTPLVSAPDWDAQFKLEYVSPTGSFKDRGATTTITRAVAVGASHVIEDSSGNAGAAIATYAARAGIDATIYAPASASPKKLDAIRNTGATLEPVPGERDAVTAACLEAVRAGDGWYASHAWNPAFTAGTMTTAIEIAYQRDWQAPAAVVVPVGHGTLLLGLYRGFRSLAAAGWIDRMPRLLVVQAQGIAPIVTARGGTDRGDPNDLAAGVQITDPVRHNEIVAAIDATDGAAIAIDADRTAEELDRLHAAGFGCEPTSGLAPAGLRRFREMGVLAPEDDVVVPLTGRN